MTADAPRNALELLPAAEAMTEDGNAEARALLASVLAEIDPSFAPTLVDTLPAALRKTGGEWWVLTVKGTVAGAVGVRGGDAPGEGELGWWGLARAWRGMGLGRWMAEQALVHARRRLGMRLVWAKLRPEARRAAGILVDLGFRGPADFDPETFDHPVLLTSGIRAPTGE